MGAEVQLIISLPDFAEQLTPWSRAEVHRRLRALSPTEAVLDLPGGIRVPVHRSAEKAGWVIYRRQFDRAVDEWEHAGQPVAPPPIAIEQEAGR